MSILENVKGISISSDYFTGNNKYILFPNENDRVAMVFGRNGSGKSTISQGFIEYANSVIPRTVDLKLITEDGSVYISPDGRLEKIFVFNENYIDSNIKIKSDGLDTIVLLGEQVGLAEQIEEVEKNIAIIVENLEKSDKIISSYSNSKNTKSPEFWINKITKTLKERWAETAGIKIKKNLKKATVNLETIDNIGTKKITKDKETLHTEFNDKMTVFESTDAKSVPILQSLTLLSYNKNIYTDSKKLLKQTVSKPTLTERESELLTLFGVDELVTSKDYINNHINSICPTCLQTITKEHSHAISVKINKIISKESEEFKKELEKLVLNNIDITIYDAFKSLDNNAFVDLIGKINNLNSLITKHNQLIKNKINNPFEPYEYINSDLATAYMDVNKAIQTIEDKRIDYNNAISDRKKLVSSLLNLNEQIAYFEIKDDYKQYKKTQIEKNEEEKNNSNLKKALSSLRTNLEKLNGKRENLQLAAESLNKELQYIFYSSKRLELSVDSTTKTYRLKINGKSVPPNKISSGERNALALCYFFADISKNMEADNPYSDEMLLVIDDPVSSFDFENKIGILSFLKYKLKEILIGSPSTKIITLTHDISMVIDFGKALDEISEYFKTTGQKTTYSTFYLHNKEMKAFLNKKQNEYTDLLTEVFDFAKSEQIDEDNSIGNQMRRVVEAFSTFSFKVGIDKLSTNKEILELLPNDKRDYFENLMYRLVLNGESHTEDSARFFPRTNFYMHLSPEEKQRTARDILSFLYLINPQHILNHMKSINNAKSVIEGWIADIS